MPRADKFPDLVSPRLILRRIAPGDAEAIHAFLGDRDHLQFWDQPPSASLGDTRALLTWLAKSTSPYEQLAWAVTERDGDRCIGLVNYHHREARNRRLEIGYVVSARHLRRGYGGEAVAALIAYCEAALRVHRIQALIHPDNAASIRLVERLGFRCEGGPLVDHWCIGDGFASPLVFARVGGAAAAGGRARG